jgi:hypothetical protein
LQLLTTQGQLQSPTLPRQITLGSRPSTLVPSGSGYAKISGLYRPWHFPTGRKHYIEQLSGHLTLQPANFQSMQA